ncbi:phenylacetate--CoA ligase family protein [Vampirovibrio sp.]|uniref:phenylacetate--CoA ligase family protein n=1 Tax=Vampirovibrio sp. TaxID=2717857 RepID=UPI003593D327
MEPLFEFQGWIKKAYRQGPIFGRYLKRLEESAQFSAEKLKRLQNRQLQKMVHHCYRNIPYYQDLFRQLKLTPAHIKTIDDLEKLPFMEKKIVNENYDKLIARRRKNILCRLGSTSGSTGTPAKFFRDYGSINFENAVVWRHWRNAGDFGKKRITLRGDSIVPASQNEPPFWKYNRANQELLMSGYHLSLANSASYIEEILRFQPEILYCYPSTAYLLAKFFQQQKVPYRFDAIFTSSESLEPHVRAYIEDVFESRIYDWYGQAERVVAICQCKAGGYHIQDDYSVVELKDSAYGQELVGTHLNNFVMPLLRYRTYDYVSPRTEACPCGSAFRLVDRILGRNYSYILTPEGYRISITNHIPRGVENLLETQFYQEKPGELIVNVLTNGHFSETDRALLVRNTLEHTSPQMNVIVNEVQGIPRGPNGKFISIINKLEVMN